MAKRWFGVLSASLCLWLGAGCDEEAYEDHVPSAGNGSLIIDAYRIFDLAPGLHRLVAAEAGEGDRSYRDDIDILEGRLTIVELWSGSTTDGYDATVRFR